MSLSTCCTSDTGVHLTLLISEKVKASIHVLKLCHDGLQGHTSYRSRRSRGRRNSRNCKIGRLHSWPLRSKLGLAQPNKISVDGTYDGEVRRISNGDREVAKDLHDSRRKDKLITGCRILIHIEDKYDEVIREVNRDILKKRQKKVSTRLDDRVIVR